MKYRITSLLLVMVLLISCAACSAADLANDGADVADVATEHSAAVTIATFSELQSFTTQFLQYANFVYPDINVEFINLYSEDQAEYDTKLIQMRTEIMAGKGPDLFLLPKASVSFTSGETGEIITYEPLFTDVTESMYNNIFLPLDEYILKSEYITPDDYPQSVYDAGKTNQGQVVLPLTYTYHFMVMDKNKMENPNLAYSTIDELLNCGDHKLLKTLKGDAASWYRSLFGKLANYENAQLAITEDDLSALAKYTLMATSTSMDYNSKVDDYYANPDWPVQEYMSNDVLSLWYRNMDDAYPLYIPNTDGGITAYISTFAGINANTAHPEETFKVLELLLSDVVQEGKTYGDYGSAITASMNSEYVVGMNAVNIDVNCGEKDEQDQLLRDMGKKITVTRFETEFEVLLAEVATGHFNYIDGTESKTDISKIYTEMKMIMAE